MLNLKNNNYLKTKSILLKMNEYLNSNYPSISKGIYEDDKEISNQDISNSFISIRVSNVKNNVEVVNNSTEIISLMLYHMLGD